MELSHGKHANIQVQVGGRYCLSAGGNIPSGTGDQRQFRGGGPIGRCFGGGGSQPHPYGAKGADRLAAVAEYYSLIVFALAGMLFAASFVTMMLVTPVIAS